MLKLSNLDKAFWPGRGITKGDLLAYYRAVAPVLVPHLRDRPFTMMRYPDGIDGERFFQKDAPSHMPDWIPTRPRTRLDAGDAAAGRSGSTSPLVNDELALLWMVNMGCIDMNTWYSRVDKPDRPDFVLFDLDPSADVGLCGDGPGRAARQGGAGRVRARVVREDERRRRHPRARPVERRHTFDDTREFAEIVARALARTHRGLVTTEWTKSKRRGVLIDSNQNGEGKTIASVYSVRPEARRARLDAASLGRGQREAQPVDLHDGRRPRPRAPATATSSRAC